MAHLPADELLSKKRNKRRKNRPPGAADNTAWAVMTPQELWKNICQEAKNYFDFSLEWCGHGTLWVVDVGQVEEMVLLVSQTASKVLGQGQWSEERREELVAEEDQWHG